MPPAALGSRLPRMTANDGRGQRPTAGTGQIVKGLLLVLLVGAGAWACLSSHDSSTSTQPTTPSWADYNGPRVGGGDAEYFYILKSHVAGITNTEGDTGLIKGGHAICDGLQEGRSRQSIFLQFVQGHGWSDSDASWVVTASVVAYCPEYVLPTDRW